MLQLDYLAGSKPLLWNDIDSFHGEKLTDLLEADLGLSRRDCLTYGGGLNFPTVTSIWSAIPSF